MNVLSFAWLRQQIGAGRETVAPPADVATVGALIDWLRGRSPGNADAFANARFVRAAVNYEFASLETAVKPGDEIAFFPPVTGG
ncbi:MAG: molybdopterin converting factor subunit 1 [Rhodospirillaceae bacterium]|nr:molybdopterin converting factor subunit 1 [Rhodospirillaceae bacterium]